MKTETALFTTLLLTSLFTHGAGGENPELLMCERGEVLLSDDFDPATVSERWFYKGEFALHDGALVRTEINREENQRVFLKDPKFHNTIIQFDFRFAGDTTNLRLVMGSVGHDNSSVEIQRGHFQVNTPDDKAAGIWGRDLLVAAAMVGIFLSHPCDTFPSAYSPSAF